MKPCDIRDEPLRQWVEDYMTEIRAERKAKRAPIEDMVNLWRAYREADWAALRRLLELRAKCAARDIGRGAQEHAIARRLNEQPKVTVHGQEYDAPYSVGLEVAALRDLLHEDVGATHVEFIPPRVQTETLYDDDQRGDGRHAH
jgi:hypothetical protein